MDQTGRKKKPTPAREKELFSKCKGRGEVSKR